LYLGTFDIADPNGAFYSGNGATVSGLTIRTSGSIDPTWKPSTIPIAYNFTMYEVGSNTGADISSWNLQMSLAGYSNGGFSVSGGPIDGATFLNQAVILGTGQILPTLDGGTNETVTAQLTVDWMDTDPDALLVVVVGPNSFDFNSPTNSAVPEPTSCRLLVFAGLSTIALIGERGLRRGAGLVAPH
jgi:hypothetical protein